MNKIFFVACLCCFYLIGASCSTIICKKKLCCPKEGHGKCPFCHIEDYETDLKNALK